MIYYMRKIISAKSITIKWIIIVELEVMWIVIKVGKSLSGIVENERKNLIKIRNKDQKSIKHLP